MQFLGKVLLGLGSLLRQPTLPSTPDAAASCETAQDTAVTADDATTCSSSPAARASCSTVCSKNGIVTVSSSSSTTSNATSTTTSSSSAFAAVPSSGRQTLPCCLNSITTLPIPALNSADVALHSIWSLKDLCRQHEKENTAPPCRSVVAGQWSAGNSTCDAVADTLAQQHKRDLRQAALRSHPLADMDCDEGSDSDGDVPRQPTAASAAQRKLRFWQRRRHRKPRNPHAVACPSAHGRHAVEQGDDAPSCSSHCQQSQQQHQQHQHQRQHQHLNGAKAPQLTHSVQAPSEIGCFLKACDYFEEHGEWPPSAENRWLALQCQMVAAEEEWISAHHQQQQQQQRAADAVRLADKRLLAVHDAVSTFLQQHPQGSFKWLPHHQLQRDMSQQRYDQQQQQRRAEVQQEQLHKDQQQPQRRAEVQQYLAQAGIKYQTFTDKQQEQLAWALEEEQYRVGNGLGRQTNSWEQREHALKLGLKLGERWLKQSRNMGMPIECMKQHRQYALCVEMRKDLAAMEDEWVLVHYRRVEEGKERHFVHALQTSITNSHNAWQQLHASRVARLQHKLSILHAYQAQQQQQQQRGDEQPQLHDQCREQQQHTQHMTGAAAGAAAESLAQQLQALGCVGVSPTQLPAVIVLTEAQLAAEHSQHAERMAQLQVEAAYRDSRRARLRLMEAANDGDPAAIPKLAAHVLAPVPPRLALFADKEYFGYLPQGDVYMPGWVAGTQELIASVQGNTVGQRAALAA